MIKIFLSISKPKRCFRNTEIELLQENLIVLTDFFFSF